jgi:hypothetical protein
MYQLFYVDPNTKEILPAQYLQKLRRYKQYVSNMHEVP